MRLARPFSRVRWTIMEKSSAPFSLGGNNVKRYFGQRYCPFFYMYQQQCFLCSDEPFLFVHSKQEALPLIEIAFRIGSDEDGAEYFSKIIRIP